MGALKSKLFTEPLQPQLEACLIRDEAHITQGVHGEHVKKIQIALNRLSEGPGRENFKLKVDGWYGPKTAGAVKAYKNAPSRRILQPWQKTADDIVGKRTMKSLDDEMDILENELPSSSRLVSDTKAGAPHDHTKCPDSPWGGSDHRVHHLATPMNPIGTKRKINIGGWKETAYLNFEDYIPDPSRDPEFREPPQGRPFSWELPDRCASDICFRATPLDRYMKGEIERIAMLGCRLTYAGPHASPYGFTFASLMSYFRSLGPIVEQGIIYENDTPPDPIDLPGQQGSHYVVVQMLMHVRK